jgi:hypothetical protein
MNEETCSKTLAVALSAAIIVAPYVYPMLVHGDQLSTNASLSPYWRPVVSRWESIVVRYAERRGLDPDLVASVIWKESRGDAGAVGPTGAVGLMCVKPFPWRPSAEELRNPWTNVAAGTRTLAQVIRDGRGDLFYALAAYNGGWDQVHLGCTRRYAADVLDNYVRAVAVGQGLPADGDWMALLSVEGLPDQSTVTVLGPGREVARYTERPWSRAAVPSVPEDYGPHATAIRFQSEHGREVRVNVWLIEGDRASNLVGGASDAWLSYTRVLGQGFEGLPD